MKYAVQFGSGATICMLSFIQTGSGIRKLTRDSQIGSMEIA
jgi:hypothetical protein